MIRGNPPASPRSPTRSRFRAAIALTALAPVLIASGIEAVNGDPPGSVRTFSSRAFEQPFEELTPEQLLRHIRGDAGFEAAFVSSPASINPGLGPHFNNVSCVSCHISDGRGRPDRIGHPHSSLVLRLSVPVSDPESEERARPARGFGSQFSDRAVHGVRPEGRLEVEYEDHAVALADGTVVSLRRPSYTIREPLYPVPDGLQISPRVAPPVFGLGLIEAIPESTILALADPGDRDRDGISGKPNWVRDPVTGGIQLGRFGLKANTPSLLAQSAAAYFNDMGITTKAFPDPHPDDPNPSDGPELAWEIVEDVTFYVQTLAAPRQRQTDHPEVLRGKQIFGEIGCASCHTPALRVGDFPGIPEISGREVYPYSDFLLHDMGPDLADGRPDFEATGSEWRTPPLWGLGLTRVVSGHTQLLHDGRARSVPEAILWHGGEAAIARDAYTNLTAADREALLKFLQSL